MIQPNSETIRTPRPSTQSGRIASRIVEQWGDGATEVDVNGHVEATTEI